MRVRQMAAVASVVVAATLMTGCGDDSSSSKSDDKTESVSDESESSEGDSQDIAAAMPDLSGLTEDEARNALLELGVAESDIVTAPQENLLAPGTVVGHVPGPGSAITGSITLKIAEPVGPVPNFAGQEVATVEAWALERGIVFREVAAPDADTPDGQVLSTTPEAGQDATSEIEVSVARTPSTKSLYLTEALNESYDCSYTDSGETFIDGDPYDGSYTSVDSDRCTFEFDLGRDWSRLTGTFGFLDRSESGTRVRIQIKIDGTSKLNKVVDFGQKPLALDVDVSEGLRLTIELSSVAGYSSVGFGDLQLVGSGDAGVDADTDSMSGTEGSLG